MARRDLPEGRAEEDNSAPSTRGGAALLLRTRSFEAGAEESEEQAHHNGRVATREVVWEEQVLQLASIYAPAAPCQRRAFLNNLIARNPLQRNAIVGGDFNTVIKVSEDVQFMSDQRNRQGYPNLHGAILNQLMHRTKLSDLHNMINGEATGGYTREGK
jgi:exonuclease III